MTEREDVGSNTIDEKIAQFLAKRTQRYSRRGALVTFGKTLLQLSGLAVIPLLPSAGCSESGGHCGWETKDASLARPSARQKARRIAGLFVPFVQYRDQLSANFSSLIAS